MSRKSMLLMGVLGVTLAGGGGIWNVNCQQQSLRYRIGAPQQPTAPFAPVSPTFAHIADTGATMLDAQFVPFDPPPLATLRASKKKVFAHYFTPFPISIDNAPSSNDYYQTQYLSWKGEKHKHKLYGGFLRQRPWPRAVRAEKEWFQKNLEDEVRRASAIGLDGFACDILSYSVDNSADYNWKRVQSLMKAAQSVDSGFRVLIMPDMTAGFTGDSKNKLRDCVRELSRYSSAFRLSDGRLVVAPYSAESKSPAWWSDWLQMMQAEKISVALVPVVQGWERYLNSYASVSVGFSDWGLRSPEPNQRWRDAARRAKRQVPIWMAPVAPQDARPKELNFHEAGNSANYRMMWENAIEGEADWVQIITWNDYSEHTEIAPSNGTQFSFYDLTAYYTTWFKTGAPPPITRDVLYYFHRVQPLPGDFDMKQQPRPFHLAAGSQRLSNNIELLAFLTEPGTLEIEIGGRKWKREAPAGITSFTVPTGEGRPVFRLLRGGTVTIKLASAFWIRQRVGVQNPVYFGGSSSRDPIQNSN